MNNLVHLAFLLKVYMDCNTTYQVYKNFLYFDQIWPELIGVDQVCSTINFLLLEKFCFYQDTILKYVSSQIHKLITC